MFYIIINVLLVLEYIWNLIYFCCVWVNKIIIKGRSFLSYRFFWRILREFKFYKMDSIFFDIIFLIFNLILYNVFKLFCLGRLIVEVVKGLNLFYNICICSL